MTYGQGIAIAGIWSSVGLVALAGYGGVTIPVAFFAMLATIFIGD